MTSKKEIDTNAKSSASDLSKFGLQSEVKEETMEQTPESDSSCNSKAQGDEKEYPTPFRLTLIMVSLCLAVLLAALDATILVTALPTITSEFNSLDNVAWYNAIFLISACSFQLPYGRAYSLLSTKWTFWFAVFLFEVGSAVSGSAPTSSALIAGRAIQGLGVAGIFNGTFIIIARTTPLDKRSIYTSLAGGMFGISAVVGPLLGGAFTTKVTWRWCFYVNLPLGCLVLVVIALFLPRSVDTQGEKLKGKSWWQIIRLFNPLQTIILLISIVCLQLALQWGSVQYSWSSPRVVATLVVFSVLIVVWFIIQWLGGEDVTVPRDVITQRSVAGAAVYMFCASAAFIQAITYLPIWFQAIKQIDAEQSGIHNLPLILTVVTFSISAGIAVSKIGYYTPFLYLGTVLISLGAGLLMTLKPDSGAGEWVGYQIIFAAGLGMSLEQCNVAVQAVLPDHRIPAGTSLAVFARTLGSSIAITIGQNVFEQNLRKNLATVLPNLNISLITGSGATNLVSNVRKLTGGNQQIVKKVLGLYNEAVTRTFLAALIFASITVIPALLVEWTNVKKGKRKSQKEELGEVKISENDG